MCSLPTSGLPPTLPDTSAFSEVAEHLRQQVAIVNDFLEQYQYRLSKPEKQWITNAIAYTTHILNSFNSEKDTQRSNATMNKPSHPWQAFASRKRNFTSSSQSRDALWNSQFVIATQDLNSAMSMLSWYAHASQPPASPVLALHNNRSQQTLPSTELSDFLNKRRVGRGTPVTHSMPKRDVLHKEVESTIAELRATNSLLRPGKTLSPCSTHKALNTAELPLTLVGTVERWRQNAEEALKAAMLGYFEQEELLKDAANDDSITQDNEKGEVVSIKTKLSVPEPVVELVNLAATRPIVSDNSHAYLGIQANNPVQLANRSLRRKPVLSLSSPQGSDTFPVSLAPPATATCSDPLDASVGAPSLLLGIPHYATRRSVDASAESSNPATTVVDESTHSPYIVRIPSSLARQPDAGLSDISLVSTITLEPRASSVIDRTDSAVSLATPIQIPAISDAAATENFDDVPQWQQPEARPDSRSLKIPFPRYHRSRGRAWLERNAAT